MAEKKKFVGAMPSGTKIGVGGTVYRVVEILGQGGFGITYKVQCISGGNLGEVFAMKEYFRKELCQREPDDSITYYDTNKDVIETGVNDFITEAKRLNTNKISHPNIVGIYNVFQANKTAYYLMEYVEGPNLLHYMAGRKNQPLSPEQALAVMQPLLQAVSLLHANRITHLDIKHENIVLQHLDNGEYRPVLIDFGLSKHYDKKGKATSTLTAAGCTDGFAPPEQYLGLTTFTPQADVYALAATLLYLLTGRWPMKSSEVSAKRLLEVLPAELPENIKAAIIHAMQKDVADRTPSVDDFAAELGLDIQQHTDSHITSTRLLDIKEKTRSSLAISAKSLKLPAFGRRKIQWVLYPLLAIIIGFISYKLVRNFQNEDETSTVSALSSSEGLNNDGSSGVSLSSLHNIAKSISGTNDIYVDKILVPYNNENDKYGFKYITGKIVIPAKFDGAHYFSEGLATVTLGLFPKYGFIDKTGNMVIPVKFDIVHSFSEGLAAVKPDGKGKWGYIDKTGNMVIPAKFDIVSDFSEGLAPVTLGLYAKYGFIDKTEEFVIPAQFDGADSFSEGLACVNLDGKYGYIDKSGQFVIPAKFDYAWDFSEGLTRVKLDGKYGYIDKSGQFVIPPKFDYAWDFSEGLAAVKPDGKGKWGYIDKTGHLVIPAKFNGADSFHNGVARVREGSRTFWIDKKGNEF